MKKLKDVLKMNKKIKTIFITQKEEVYSNIILKEMLKSEKIEVTGVITSTTLVHKKNTLQSLWYYYKQSGLLYIHLRILEKIKKKTAKLDTIKNTIKKHNLLHYETNDINNKQSLAIIKKLSPKVMVCCVFNQIFKKEIIKIPPKGIINIHRSYLPKYRGVSPVFWALAYDIPGTGITAHIVTKDIDKGDILIQRKSEIFKDDTIHTLSLRLMESIKKGFVKDLIRYVNNSKKPKKIKDLWNEYFPPPTRECVMNFIRKGKKII